MKKLILVLISVLLLGGNVFAQEESPFISGTVKISITEGTFDCDLTVSDIPRMKDYFIRINSGMNILNFQSLEPNNFVIGEGKKYDKNAFEAMSYYFPDNTGKGKFMPQKLRVRYVGKYPVANDTINNYAKSDWKGNIAFNGYSVRADGMQTAWYPVLYDVELDKRYDNVRYDIEVICEDAEVIYLNGDIPYKGTRNRFKSEKPVQICLYAGKFEVKNIGGTYFLNPNISDNYLKDLGGFTNEVEKYYAENLSIPYGGNVVYVNTTPTSKYNSWMFVSFPSIFNISHKGLKEFVDPKWANNYKQSFAHEVGHYYFGTYKIFNSGLGDVMSEGLSEYVSLKAAYKFIGKEFYNELIDRKIKRLEEFKPTPFSKIESQDDYKNRELYSYHYGPLLFEAMEKEIGSKDMWKWLNAILVTEADFTDYKFLEKTLGMVINDKKLQLIKDKYWESGNSMDNIIKTLKPV